MADQKISELTALTGANVADDDAIAIVDTSATETKKIVFSELKNALDTATGFVRITGDTISMEWRCRCWRMRGKIIKSRAPLSKNKVQPTQRQPRKAI